MTNTQVGVKTKYYNVKEATDDGPEEEDDYEDECCHRYVLYHRKGL